MATELALKIYSDGVRVESLRNAVSVARLFDFKVFLMPVFSEKQVETIIEIESCNDLMRQARALFQESRSREIYVLPSKRIKA